MSLLILQQYQHPPDPHIIIIVHLIRVNILVTLRKTYTDTRDPDIGTTSFIDVTNANLFQIL